MRKQMSLQELEVVSVNIECDKEFEKYIREHQGTIEKDTRSKITLGKPKTQGFEKTWDVEGSNLLITIVRN